MTVQHGCGKRSLGTPRAAVQESVECGAGDVRLAGTRTQSHRFATCCGLGRILSAIAPVAAEIKPGRPPKIAVVMAMMNEAYTACERYLLANIRLRPNTL